MLCALIIQHLFSIPTDSLLLVFLHYSRPLREFCGFTKVPDASKITRFKQDFLSDLQSVFDNLVDITEPICQDIDNNLASMLCLILPALKLMLPKITLNMPTALLNSLKPMQKPITLTVLMILYFQ